MIQIDIDMPTDCASCWIRQNMGCKIANESGWLNNRWDDKCPLKEQEPKPVGKEWNECPSCGKTLDRIHDMHYCGVCGQAVKWDG